MAEKMGKRFVEMTKFRNLEASEQMKGAPQPPVESAYDKTKPVIDLPGPEGIEAGDMSLRTAIEKRESRRDYTREALSLEELSFLLWCTQGVKEVVPGATFRTVPSAGARHAIETFLLVNNVRGLERGLYRFLAIGHKLININAPPDISRKMTGACLGQEMVSSGAVTFLWVAVPYRMTWRYGERGYRYLYLDAGHICQNLYLSAGSIGCGVCAIGAYLDDKVNGLLDIDGEEQFVIYIASVGRVSP